MACHGFTLKVERDSLFRSLCSWLNIIRFVFSDLSFINSGCVPLPLDRFPSRRAWRISVDGIFLSQELHVSTKNALSSNFLSSVEFASDSLVGKKRSDSTINDMKRSQKLGLDTKRSEIDLFRFEKI